MKLNDYISNYIQDNEVIESSKLKESITVFIEKNNISISSINNFVNRELHKLSKEGIIKNISRGKYIYSKNIENISASKYEEIGNNLYDHQKSISELSIHLEFAKDWIFDSISFEQYIKLNMQRGSKLSIILNGKPSQKLIHKLDDLNIAYSYTYNKVDNIVVYALVKMLSNKKYSDDDVSRIAYYMKKNSINYHDLLSHNISIVQNLLTVNRNVLWREMDRANKYQNTFKDNYIKIEGKLNKHE